MSVESARREAAALRAGFAQAVDDSTPILQHVIQVIGEAGNGNLDPDTLAQACRLTIRALSSLQDMATTWHAVESLMDEVER